MKETNGIIRPVGWVKCGSKVLFGLEGVSRIVRSHNHENDDGEDQSTL